MMSSAMSVGVFSTLFSSGASHSEVFMRPVRGHEHDHVNSDASSAASASSCAMLKNEGTHFTLDVRVGTPMDQTGQQHLSLVADTGSDSVIVRSCTCERCSYPEGGEKICFQGTNRSSTFNLVKRQSGHLDAMQITFGSGTVQCVVASDMVEIGGVSTQMSDGLLLMTDEALNFPGGLEGIFGLGPPKARSDKKDKSRAATPAEQQQDLQGGQVVSWEDLMRAMGAGRGVDPFGGIASNGDSPSSAIQGPHSGGPSQVSFLEKAGVNRFAMCFGGDDNGNGKLTLNSPEQGKAISNIGVDHWGMELSGISVGGLPAGNVSAPLCSNEAEVKGTSMNCGAIPDSGTTLITADKQHIDALLESICSQWDHCQKNLTALTKARDEAVRVSEKWSNLTDPFGLANAQLPGSLVLKLLLADCHRWLPEDQDEATAWLNREMPTVEFSVKDGKHTQLLKLNPEHYVIEQLFSPNKSLTDPTVTSLLQIEDKQRVCLPAFGEMQYTTEANGPVWIMGTPLFYAYEVGYSLKPAQMSFTEGKCSTCDVQGHIPDMELRSQLQKGPAELVRPRGALRRVAGSPRRPRVDSSKPI